MKRTITLRVDVKDDMDYADTVARIVNSNTSIVGWTLTGMSVLVKQRLAARGIPVKYIKGHGCEWLQKERR